MSGEGEVSRRGFVKAMGASLAAAGLQACVEPPDTPILPYVRQPPEVVPGIPVSYATALIRDGYATGLLVQAREGRPIKVEGNPEHPASLGATGVFEQAYLLQLYDAGRGRRLTGPDGEAVSSARLGEALRGDWRGPDGRGRGLHVLLSPTASPTRIRLLEALSAACPEARVHFHSPTGPSRAVEAFSRLTGSSLVPRYDFSRARTVVSFDGDFLTGMPFHLAYARAFARGRSTSRPEEEMSRLYLAEPTPSPTAVLADHSLPVRSGDIPFLLGMLAAELDVGTRGLPQAPVRLDTERVHRWIGAAARDLQGHPGEAVIVVGEAQPPAAHGLAHRINVALGAVGGAVTLQQCVLHRPEAIRGGLEDLAAAAASGAVERLAVLEENPVYTSPADLDLGEILASIPHTLHLGMYRNETSERCGWYIPSRHPLEVWGDGRSFDGTVSPVQPLVRPLLAGSDADEILALLAGLPASTGRERVRRTWRESSFAPGGPEGFEVFWEEALSRGLVQGTGCASGEGCAGIGPEPVLDQDGLAALLAEVVAPSEGVELCLRPDPRVGDGRFAENSWLQELPNPTTKQTWGNALLLAPATARSLGVAEGDAVRVVRGGREVVAPALPVPGQAEGSATLSLGYGREGMSGVDGYRLRTTDRPWAMPVELAAAPEHPPFELAVSQPEWRQHDRPIALERTLEEYRRDPAFTASHRGDVETWYTPPEIRPAERQWGMTVDLSACTGCGACTVACQAENNIPVVGPEEVRNGRIMHWIRIDRYVVGPDDDPEAHLRQPMLCQHCEKAPCEYVCPVNATVHSADGLNEMVYNRCIGTRFCSNNCPYKVRRFNWFDYNESRPPMERLVLNPDVTVRERGVMEKCTYCVQRIRREENRARAEDREMEPGAVVTACQQVCPTEAIVFGDLTTEGPLRRSMENPRMYAVLHELGTEPRTRYLAKVTNPAPELDQEREA